MRSQEDQVWDLPCWQRAQNVEAVHSRHLYIQEDQVGRKIEYFLHGCHAIAALSDDLNILELLQP
jgi:hypothetical protein